MMHSSLEFQVKQLRMKSVIKTLEAVAVFMLCLFVTAYLPSIMVRYVYAGQQLMEQPRLLEFLPIAAFAVGVSYFVYAMVGNILREIQAVKMEKDALEMRLMWDGDCCGGNCGHHEMHDMQEMVAAAEAPVTKPERKAEAKSTTKSKKAKKK